MSESVSSDPILVASGIHKKYRMGSEEILILQGLSMTLAEGEILAVVGASGVGKSTLLHILGLLDTPDQGTVTFRGEDLFALPPKQRAERRNRVFGFIFQFYHLIPELTALENVLLPSMIGPGFLAWRRVRRERREKALGILGDLGLSHRLKHRPAQLSGGERQRVAIGRALMNDPAVLLCDEPTGNLDPVTRVGVQEALWGLNRRRGQTILVVTHDERMAAEAHRVARMDHGALVEESTGGASA
jgi:lipoprotein-releasing system ATP-binding protein